MGPNDKVAETHSWDWHIVRLRQIGLSTFNVVTSASHFHHGIFTSLLLGKLPTNSVKLYIYIDHYYVLMTEEDTRLCKHEWAITIQLFGNLTILGCLAIYF